MGWIQQNVALDVANYLFNIKIDCLPSKVGVYQRDVRPDLIINYDQLETQLEETPEMLAFWDMLLAAQKAECARLERKKDIYRGLIRKRILREAEMEGVKLRGEDVKDVICADKELIAIERELLQEQYKEDRVRAIVFAIRMKAEHLRSLAGFKREEQRQVGK